MRYWSERAGRNAGLFVLRKPYNTQGVMAGHSRPKDGVATLAYVPAIHALSLSDVVKQGVDARDKRGHDEREGLRLGLPPQ